jgi:hypothetical protein
MVQGTPRSRRTPEPQSIIVLACSVEMLVLAFGYPTQANGGLEWGSQNLW